MNLFHDRFATGQVVTATGVPNPTLQSWLKRDLIVGHKDNPIVGGGSPGAHRRFSFYNVMEIAIAKGLLDIGLGSVTNAFMAATSFAHVGGSGIGNEPDRHPGLPFDTRPRAGYTLLCVAGERRAAIHWTPGVDPLAIIRHRLGNAGGFVMLEIDPIFWSVTHRLGYDHRDVLELAYPGQPKAPVWDDAAIQPLADE
ncbi:hypothetical protein [Sphingomonas sp.]|uniref:hypothetical protein n=1 Tax=Sphingomonas sp. TaxID=28214 RepID=UPI003AFFD38A